MAYGLKVSSCLPLKESANQQRIFERAQIRNPSLIMGVQGAANRILCQSVYIDVRSVPSEKPLSKKVHLGDL